MKFKKIILENFRQFSGKNEIDFALEESQNITVIHAMNGSGKTTLLESFRWALYGGQLDLDNPKEVLNRDLALQDGKYDVGITLKFVHLGVDYILKRYYHGVRVYNKAYNLPKEKLDLLSIENGVSKSTYGDEAQKIINGFFSRQVSDYFFYDGERIKVLGENRAAASHDISRGMDSIMNVVYVKAVVDRLRKEILPSYNSQYDQSAKQKLEKLDHELNEIENRLASLSRQYAETEDKIDANTTKIEDLDMEILRHKNLEDIQKEILSNEKIIKQNQISIKNMLSGVEIKKRVEGNVTTKKSVYSVPLKTTSYVKTSLIEVMLQKATSRAENIHVVSEDIQGLTEELLKRMEKLGNCVCGHEVTAYEIQNLRSKLDDAKDVEQLKRAISDFTYFSKNKLISEKSDSAYEEFEQVKENYDELIEQNRKLNLKNQNLRETLNKTYDFNKNYELKSQLQSENSQLNQKLGELNMKMTGFNGKKQTKIEEQEQIRAAAHLNEKTALHVKTVKELITIGEVAINKKKKQAEEVLIQKTKAFFEQMAHKGTKYIEVKTTPYYKYEVYNKIDRKKSSLSEGERNIASLSYIAGIIAAAKTHYRTAKDTSDLIDDGAEISLILDAPFAKLDSVHIQNVATIVPQLADQVILFTVDQQFMGSAQKAVANRIGKQYVMTNTNDSAVTLTLKS